MAPIAAGTPGADDRCMAQPAIPDTESLGWQRALSGTDSGRHHALVRLHALLLHAARFEVARRRRTGDEDLDGLAVQAADDALRAILSRLHTYRGDTRFTSWAYKYALHEAAVKLRERCRELRRRSARRARAH